MPRSSPCSVAPAPARRPSIVAVAVATGLLGGLVPVLLPAATPVAIARPSAIARPVAAPGGAAVAGVAPGARRAVGDPDPLPAGDWLWPVEGARTVIAPFRAPAHDYGPGHRGMDVAATQGSVRAPASGVVAFRGVVVDRPLLTIDHGDGLVTTLEPVRSDLSAGVVVRRGDAIATLSVGGHTPAGALHVGVRWNGAYINPMLLFGGVPRAVLLPCGAGGC
ncbi:murein hydrolase activator EnvC family protein [Microbacterium sp. NPDC056052]|uniref:murein hydrolase activator EnvC family protein n=1 Tax=Microbacterium sp. NPDC056052 TaxID=3345695 RepID=UPI0035E226CE